MGKEKKYPDMTFVHLNGRTKKIWNVKKLNYNAEKDIYTITYDEGMGSYTVVLRHGWRIVDIIDKKGSSIKYAGIL